MPTLDFARALTPLDWLLLAAVALAVARGAARRLVRGAVAALVWSLVAWSLALAALAAAPGVPARVAELIDRSAVASRLASATTDALAALESRLDGPFGVVLRPPPGGAPGRGAEATDDGRSSVPVPAVAADVLAPDPEAEARMLELVNRERATRGLAPLAADPALREVARAHSREMFERGYFSHQSPHTGTPFDRLRRAGVRYLVAGENLAYAPSVAIAHRGLMESPGHRANLLRPEFGRVGIGVMKSPRGARMFTQNFRN